MKTLPVERVLRRKLHDYRAQCGPAREDISLGGRNWAALAAMGTNLNVATVNVASFASPKEFKSSCDKNTAITAASAAFSETYTLLMNPFIDLGLDGLCGAL